jgi:3-phenylpropionate/trans-cinnamate dioxygenase ferredoxin reductase subunit
VQNAVEQAKAAAAALMGVEKPFTAAPWFWSDQYGIKLQMVGLTGGFDEVIERGSREDVHFSFFYFRAGKLIAIDSFNAPQDHMIGRKLLDTANTLTPRQAANSEFDLKSALG